MKNQTYEIICRLIFVGILFGIVSPPTQAKDLYLLNALVSSDCDISSDVTLLSYSKRKTSPQARLDAITRIRTCVAMSKIQKYADLSSLNRDDTRRQSLLSDIQGVQAFEKLVDDRFIDEKNDTNFLGVAFGVAFGFSAGAERVTVADIAADGTIRATKQVKHLPRVILEVHKYICKTDAAESDCNAAESGTGPFFAIVADNNSISSFGFGIMHGWRDANSTDSSSGFSIGIGAVLDESVTQLANGFVVGQKPPTGETAPKFTTKSSWSPLVIFSRTF